MPRAVDIGGMLRFSDIVKPVTPAKPADTLLRLHHDIAHGGKRHIATHLSAQLFVAFHTRIKQLDEPQPKTALPAKFLDLPGEIDAKHRHDAGFIAVRTYHHRHRVLAGSEKNIQHGLRQYAIPDDRRRGDVEWRGQRPE